MPAANVIAECGLCHDGRFDRAQQMIAAARKAGAAAVKFQKRSSAEWFADPTPRPTDRVSFGVTVGQHRRALEFNAAEHAMLRRQAEAMGLGYGVSVWDRESIDEAASVIRPTWVKIGRPAMIGPGGRDLLRATMLRFADPYIHVSCRDEAEASAVREECPAAVIYYCPGRYPDVDSEVDAAGGMRRIHALGLSVHSRQIRHAIEAVGAERTKFPACRWVEYHFALPDTRHADAAYSLDPERLGELCRCLSTT